MNTEITGNGPDNTTESSVRIFRRPEPKDETDRIGREIVRRMIEAGVVEPK